MNPGKVFRDLFIVIILIVVVYAGIQLLGSKSPGPVERARSMADTGQDMHTHDAPMGHVTEQFELSDGEPIVVFGEYSVGRDWYDENVAIEIETQVSQNIERSVASQSATELTLISGLVDIIFDFSVAELGIEPHPDEMALRENAFYDSFESTDEANAVLEEMGITMDRLREMWTDELVPEALVTEVATRNNVEPGTVEADEFFQSWLEDNIISSEWVFNDPDIEMLYNSYVEAVRNLRVDTPDDNTVGDL